MKNVLIVILFQAREVRDKPLEQLFISITEETDVLIELMLHTK